MINLQPLFDEPILEQKPFDPGYSGHASHVIYVRTASEEAVARACRYAEVGGAFWTGCLRMFGINPVQTHELEKLNRRLNTYSPLRVPQVLRKAVLDDREWVVVEYMPGHDLTTFCGQPTSLLEEFGAALAQFHRQRYAHHGCLTNGFKRPLAEFHTDMVATMRELVAQFHSNNAAITAALEPMCEAALALPAPEYAAPVMVDLDPRQFLTDGQRVTAIVDTEGYVAAPRALDFIALEYVMDAPTAEAFKRGYSAYLSLPDLTARRPVYRYFYRLLEVQGGEVPLDVWLNWPALF